MAALLSNGGQFCGGTLVASKYVVTAAHCMFLDQDATQPVSASDITVRLGEHDLASSTDTTILKDVKVKSIMNHESYKPATGSLNNDITVLELEEEVDINTYTPACLAQTTDATTFDGKNALVYGWGTTSSGGASSSVLLEVEVPVVTKATCESAMGPMEDGQICAGGTLDKDACQVIILTHLSVLSASDPGRLRRSSQLREQWPACPHWRRQLRGRLRETG